MEVASKEIDSLRVDDDVIYDIYRSACVKQFELVLEQSGNLLCERLVEFFASNRKADHLTFRNLFRHAAKHELMDIDEVERWLNYRDHRNDTAHKYGEDFAENTLKLLPEFIDDAKRFCEMIEAANDS